jgi:hypothetical protein
MAQSGKFRCKSCGRVFGMAAHLGRHMNTLHARAGRPAPSRSSVRPVPPRARGPVVDVMAGILRELSARRAELTAQRATLESRAMALDRAITALGGAVAGAKVHHRGNRRRAIHEGSLPAYIRRVLHAHRKPMTIKEVTAAVLKAGLKSRNKELPKTVGKYLAKLPGVTKVARGVFRLG